MKPFPSLGNEVFPAWVSSARRSRAVPFTSPCAPTGHDRPRGQAPRSQCPKPNFKHHSGAGRATREVPAAPSALPPGQKGFSAGVVISTPKGDASTSRCRAVSPGHLRATSPCPSQVLGAGEVFSIPSQLGLELGSASPAPPPLISNMARFFGGVTRRKPFFPMGFPHPGLREPSLRPKPAAGCPRGPWGPRGPVPTTLFPQPQPPKSSPSLRRSSA